MKPPIIPCQEKPQPTIETLQKEITATLTRIFQYHGRADADRRGFVASGILVHRIKGLFPTWQTKPAVIARILASAQLFTDTLYKATAPELVQYQLLTPADETALRAIPEVRNILGYPTAPTLDRDIVKSLYDLATFTSSYIADYYSIGSDDLALLRAVKVPVGNTIIPEQETYLQLGSSQAVDTTSPSRGYALETPEELSLDKVVTAFLAQATPTAP